MDLADVYRIFQQNTKKYNLFSVLMGHSPKLITYWNTKQPLTNVRKLK